MILRQIQINDKAKPHTELGVKQEVAGDTEACAVCAAVMHRVGWLRSPNNEKLSLHGRGKAYMWALRCCVCCSMHPPGHTAKTSGRVGYLDESGDSVRGGLGTGSGAEAVVGAILRNETKTHLYDADTVGEVTLGFRDGGLNRCLRGLLAWGVACRAVPQPEMKKKKRNGVAEEKEKVEGTLHQYKTQRVGAMMRQMHESKLIQARLVASE